MHSSDPPLFNFFREGIWRIKKKRVWKYGAEAGLLKEAGGTFSI